MEQNLPQVLVTVSDNQSLSGELKQGNDCCVAFHVAHHMLIYFY